jgi:hypothetical protein
MKEQVQDIWADLRDRQLWPVAALLLLALVAVPVVLVKPAEEAPSQAATPRAAGASGDPLAQQAVVKAFDSKPLVRISNLDQFSAKDPFKPMAQLAAVDKALTDAAGGSGAQPGSAGGAGGGSSDGGAPGGAPDSGTPGTGTPDSGTPGDGGGTTKPPRKYTYTVDLTFVDGEKAKHHKSFDRLGMLPSAGSPLLVFLGVDSGGTKAAFLVDSSLQANGEGECSPSTADCGVVYLEPGQEHGFTEADGHTYTLRIDQIHTESVANASRSAKARARTATGPPTRRFLFPVLIDLETGGHP